MIDWRTATNEEALAEWDRGGSVWSCELGGLGPSYEQCIQIMGFELLRAMLADPFDFEGKDGDKDAWRAYVDKIEKQPGPKAVIEKLGPSGAQFGAAMNIASVFARNGYSKGMEKVPEDRRIQVRKDFPRMTRKLNDRQKSVPQVRENFTPDWELLDRDSGKAARTTSPVREGDVIRFMDGDTVREALVVTLGAKLLEYSGDWLPFYNVRVKRKDGGWSDAWRRIWPGDIGRAQLHQSVA